MKRHVRGAAAALPEAHLVTAPLGRGALPGLVAEGILYKKRGIGMFVSRGAGEAVKQKRKAAFYDGYVKPLVKEGASLELTGEELLAMVRKAIGEGEHL